MRKKIMGNLPAWCSHREGLIVEKLEETLSFLDCLDEGVCEKSGRCPAQNVWRKLSEAMAETLRKITLENMVEDQKTMHTLLTFDI